MAVESTSGAISRIRLADALEIMNEHSPEGRFLLPAALGCVGILNLRGTVTTRWFEKESECLDWLEKGDENGDTEGGGGP